MNNNAEEFVPGQSGAGTGTSINAKDFTPVRSGNSETKWQTSPSRGNSSQRGPPPRNNQNRDQNQGSDTYRQNARSSSYSSNSKQQNQNQSNSGHYSNWGNNNNNSEGNFSKQRFERGLSNTKPYSSYDKDPSQRQSAGAGVRDFARGGPRGGRFTQDPNNQPRSSRPSRATPESGVSSQKGVGTTGEGESESNLNTISYDKKVMAAYVVDLKSIIEQAKFDQQYSSGADQDQDQVFSDQTQMIRNLVAEICMVRLPNRKPCWAKEVATAVFILGFIPLKWLRSSDLANISRLVTRASVEKQLVLSSEEVAGIFSLLVGHLKNTIEQQAVDDNFSGDQYLHEIIRGLAQLLILRSDQVMRHRSEALQILLKFCQPKSMVNHDARHTAVDGIGNVLRIPANSNCLIPSERGLKMMDENTNIDSISSSQQNPYDSPHVIQELAEYIETLHSQGEDIASAETMSVAARRAVYHRMKAEELEQIQNDCAFTLLENLKSSSAKFMAIERSDTINVSSHMFSSHSKLLVSCMRSVAAALIAAQPFSPHTLMLFKQTQTTQGNSNKPASTAGNSNDTSANLSAAGGKNRASESSSRLDRLKMGILAPSSASVSSSSPESVNVDIPFATPHFSHHLQSIIQSCYFLFNKLLPSIINMEESMFAGRPSLNSKAIAVRNSIVGLSNVNSPEHKMWSHSIKLFSAVAQYDPQIMMGSWPLFLTDSTSHEKQINDTCDQCFSILKVFKHGNCPVLDAEEKNTYSLLTSPYGLPQFKSPILEAACWAEQPSIRAAAVQSLRMMLNGLPLLKFLKSKSGLKSMSSKVYLDAWDVTDTADEDKRQLVSEKKMPRANVNFASTSDKMAQFVLKIFRTLCLILRVEREESVVNECLQCANVIISKVPLAFVIHEDISPSRKQEFVAVPENRGGGYTHKRLTGALEDLTILFFYNVLVLACENPFVSMVLEKDIANADVTFGTRDGAAESSSYGAAGSKEVELIVDPAIASSLRGQNSSLHALHWLSDICRNRRSDAAKATDEMSSYSGTLLSLQIALQMSAYCPNMTSPVRDPRFTKQQPLPSVAIPEDTHSFIRVLASFCSLADDVRISPFVNLSYNNTCRGLIHGLLLSYRHLFLQEPEGTSYFVKRVSTLERKIDLPCAWLREFVSDCRASCHASMRLLGIKMICSSLALECGTLENDDDGVSSARKKEYNDEGDNFNNRRLLEPDSGEVVSMDTVLGTHTLMEITVMLLRSSRDPDHQIRGQAVSSFGLFSDSIWKALRKDTGFLSVRALGAMGYGPAVTAMGNGTSGTTEEASRGGVDGMAPLVLGNESAAGIMPPPPRMEFSLSGLAEQPSGEVDTSIRAAVLQCLILACGDQVGTVRMSAQKSLGDAVVVGGLNVTGRKDDGKGSGSSSSYGKGWDSYSGYNEPAAIPSVNSRIFVVAGSNAVQKRLDKAEQVQAEALAKARSQNQAVALQSGSQRMEQIERWRVEQMGGMQNMDDHGGNSGSAPRISHQIDTNSSFTLVGSENSRSTDLSFLKLMGGGDATIDAVSDGKYEDLIIAVLNCFRDGCQDSKLAVRLQATWALGNLLLLILPRRQLFTFPSGSIVGHSGLTSGLSGSGLMGSSSGPRGGILGPDSGSLIDGIGGGIDPNAIQPDWTDDTTWLSLCNVGMGLLEDSDKLLASTVRCLGFVAAGLSPWDGVHFAHLSAIVSALVQKVLLSGTQSSQRDRDLGLQRCIQGHPHKLVFSVCQSLGFVGWVLVNRGDNDADGVTPAVTSCINSVRSVQSDMLRYGKLKVQTQACKSLVSLIHDYCAGDGPLDLREGGTAFEEESHTRAIEACLTVISTQNDQVDFNEPSPANTKGSTQTLQRSLIVLLWIILRQLHVPEGGGSSNSGGSAVQILIHNAQSTADWLASVGADTKQLAPSEVSMTAAPLASTAPISALRMVTNNGGGHTDFSNNASLDTPASLVPQVAARYMQVLGQSTDTANFSSIGRSSLGDLSLITEATIEKFSQLAAGDFSCIVPPVLKSKLSTPTKEPSSARESPSNVAVQSGLSVLVSPPSKEPAVEEEEEDPDEI